MTRKDAERRLDYVRGLRIRLLGDRVPQSVAWKVADGRGPPNTFDAEYVALTQLQAGALITLDVTLAHASGSRSIQRHMNESVTGWEGFLDTCQFLDPHPSVRHRRKLQARGRIA
jgi:hypothetical protein